MTKLKFITKAAFALSALLTAVFFAGCSNEKFPQCRYAINDYVPDSSKAALAEWVKGTVSAASYHMSGGDYEDPEDVIEQAERTGRDLFEVKIEGLEYRQCDQCYWEFIARPDLNERQQKLCDSLKNCR